MSLTLSGSVALLLSVHSALGSVVTNVASSGFQRWPGNIIYYSVDQPPYGINNNLKDLGNLRQAMQQVSLDMGYCVNFTQWQPSMGSVPRVVFQSAFSSPSTPNAMCFTYPGYYPAGGANGQIATLFGAASGNSVGNCMDNPRDAMKFVVNMMGLQNEWQRLDRDTYLTGLSGTPNDPNTLVSSTLQQYQLFSQTRKYTAAQATSQGSDFDYNSITMVNGNRYAASLNQPVFTLPNGKTTWQQARLSKGDCTALAALYSCPITGWGPTPTCDKLPDPASAGSGVTFSPSPSTLTRSVTCGTTGSSNPAFNGPVTLGSFVINGVGVAATQQPTLTYSPAIDGVTLVSPALASAAPLTPAATTGVAPITPTCTVPSTTATGCVYIAQFQLTSLPTRSYVNQQVTVTVTVPSTNGNGQQQTYTVPVTLNLNCAPVWQSATAYQVGPAGPVASAQTRTAGSGATALNAVSPYKVTSSGTLSVAALTDAPPYLVNNIAEFGFYGAIGGTVTKLFVNCWAAASGGTLATGGDGNAIGTTVIGQVQATDPDAGRVSYYSWSGQKAREVDENVRFDVSPDGIVTMTVTQTPVSAATVSATAPLPANTPLAAASPQKGVPVVNTKPFAVYITAVDPSGGASTLEYRFWPACGPTS